MIHVPWSGHTSEKSNEAEQKTIAVFDKTFKKVDKKMALFMALSKSTGVKVIKVFKLNNYIVGLI